VGADSGEAIGTLLMYPNSKNGNEVDG